MSSLKALSVDGSRDEQNKSVVVGKASSLDAVAVNTGNVQKSPVVNLGVLVEFVETILMKR